MILYENTVSNFLSSIKERSLVTFMMDEYYRRVSRILSKEAKNNWKYTMEVLKQLIENIELAEDCGIRIDYVVLESFNRFEVMIAGYDKDGGIKIGQISFFPWEYVEKADQTDFVKCSEDGVEFAEVLHPSFQSITYKKYLLRDKKNINVNSYVYMYECTNSATKEMIDIEKNLLEEAPIFFSYDSAILEEKLRNYSDLHQGLIALNTLHSSDHLSGKSAEIFLKEISQDISNVDYSQDQTLVISTICDMAIRKEPGLIIIDGDPGTGKTMAGISAMASLEKRGCNTCYINSAYMQSVVLKEQSLKSFGTKLQIIDAESFFKEKLDSQDDIDVLIIDEAQNLFSMNFLKKEMQLNSRFGKLMDKIPLVVVIHSSSQMIRGRESTKLVFEEKARELNRKIIYRYLSSNVRFAGKGSGVRWIAHQFQVANTENFEDWDYDSYKIELVERPEDLREALEMEEGYKRILVNANSIKELKKNSAGQYCYRLEKEEFEIPMYMKNDWISNEGTNYAGNVYTVQGLDFDYAGVIIGPELSYDKECGKVLVLNADTEKEIDLIRNIYYVLLSRAMKGVYIYISDEALRDYFEEKLFYSSRRFNWIKQLSEYYTDDAELEILEEQENSEEKRDYVIKTYKAVNEFIEEIKHFTEEELDEEKYKEISDKCSEFLLKIQMGPLNMEKIFKRYQKSIMENMGINAWSKLSDTGRKCLISAEMTYRDMRDYNSLYDFSSVCLQASKAVEYELTKRFYNDYISYFESKLTLQKEDDRFANCLPESITRTVYKKKAGKKIESKRILRETEVTLGTIPFIVGIDNAGNVTDKAGFEAFYNYANDKLLIDGIDAFETLKRHIVYIIRIKNDYRNKAAHKNTMDIVSAKACLDYVIDVQRTLAEMLDDYKE